MCQRKDYTDCEELEEKDRDFDERFLALDLGATDHVNVEIFAVERLFEFDLTEEGRIRSEVFFNDAADGQDGLAAKDVVFTVDFGDVVGVDAGSDALARRESEAMEIHAAIVAGAAVAVFDAGRDDSECGVAFEVGDILGAESVCRRLSTNLAGVNDLGSFVLFVFGGENVLRKGFYAKAGKETDRETNPNIIS